MQIQEDSITFGCKAQSACASAEVLGTKLWGTSDLHPLVDFGLRFKTKLLQLSLGRLSSNSSKAVALLGWEQERGSWSQRAFF